MHWYEQLMIGIFTIAIGVVVIGFALAVARQMWREAGESKQEQKKNAIV